MNLQELIEQFNEELKTDFEIEDIGCSISFDDKLVVILEIQESNHILLNSKISDCPPYPLENLYMSMLMGNHLFHDTKGATLSVNPRTKEICLSKALSENGLEFNQFKDELENFVHTIEFWKEIINNYDGGEKEDINIKNNFMRI